MEDARSVAAMLFSVDFGAKMNEYVIMTTEFIIRMKKCFDQNENNLMRMKFC